MSVAPNTLDAVDRRIVGELQHGFPVCERPYAMAAAMLGLEEDALIARVERLLADGVLTRFGPLFDASRLGGAFMLAALAVPPDDFERVAALVNAHVEVAHNYARDHALNMWFVLASTDAARIASTIAAIEEETGLAVHPFPKEREFFVDLRVPA